VTLDEETRQKLGALLAEQRNLRQRESEIIDEFLNYLGASFKEKKPEVYDQLPWERRQGNRGPFETCNKNSAGNSDLYRHLFLQLKANNGRLSLRDYFFWLDTRNDATDPTAIFRRKKKR